MLLHELGHLAGMLLTGAKITGFGVTGGGMLIGCDMRRLSYCREAFVYLSGAAANLAAAYFTSGTRGAFAMSEETRLQFITVNLALAAFNLMPVRSLDGGNALRALLNLRMRDAFAAERICGAVSFASLVVIWAASVWVQLVYGGSLCVMLVTLYLIITSADIFGV